MKGGAGESNQQTQTQENPPVIIPQVINQPYVANNPFAQPRPYRPRPTTTTTTTTTTNNPGTQTQPNPTTNNSGTQTPAKPAYNPTVQTVRPTFQNTKPQQINVTSGPPPINQPAPTVAFQYYAPTGIPTAPKIENNYIIPTNKNLTYMNLPTGALALGESVTLPVQKVYNLNIPGPIGGHSTVQRIYEDMIPNKNPQLVYSTLGERLVFYNYLRSILINFYDGENAGIGGKNIQSYYDLCQSRTKYAKGQRSILEFLKVLNVNPNKFSIFEKNPYLMLPKNLLIFNTCYPIVFDEVSGGAMCAKNSVGLQMRIYALNVAEYVSHVTRDPLFKKYDVWRELLFYEMIREEILKKKVCPHFPIDYGYVLSPNSQIDFGVLSRRPDNERDRITKDYQDFLFREGVIKRTVSVSTDAYVARARYIWNEIFPLPDEIDPSLQKYSGQCLVVMTEAPTFNIYLWASRQYNVKGIVNKMTNHGYHQAFEWINVLFQIAVAMAVMQKYRIYLADMTLEDNVYIKDLHTEGNNVGYWRYVIGGRSYFLPNLGYLVMIDSNFKDITKDGLINEESSRSYKLAIDDLFEKVDKDVLDKEIYANFKNLFNPNNFSPEYLSNNVNPLPDEIITLIKNINDDTEIDITKLLGKYFTDFFHDRIGTNLNEREVSNLKSVNDVFKVGELVAFTPSVNNYVWVMIDEINNDQARIFNRVTNPTTGIVTPEYSTIPINSLRQYPSLISIDHVFKVENRIVDADLLETYII